MRALIFILFIALSTVPLSAEPHFYTLEAQHSQVGFSWDLGADQVQGHMPVARADLSIDFAALSNSTIDVEVDVTRAIAGFPFATQAMKGPKILDAGQHPRIKFVSTAVIAQGTTAQVQGNITLRGITRPMVFSAEIFRERGTEPSDRSRLVIQLIGALNRSDFGATGWGDLAGDQVRLNILAHIRRVQ